MNCPNCHSGELVPLNEAIAMCNSCGYILEPRAWGLEKPSVPYIRQPDALDRLEYAIQKLLAGLGLGS